MKETVLKLGVVGSGRIANRFMNEVKYVEGISVEGVLSRNLDSANKFCDKYNLNFATTNYCDLLNKIDAVYIASPHLTHYQYIKYALLRGKHVLCEKPIVLKVEEAIELYGLSNEKGLVLLEAIKTAYCPGFIALIEKLESGVIGDIKSIDATFTKLTPDGLREVSRGTAGGSITELGSYPLLIIVKLIKEELNNINFYSYFHEHVDVDLYTKINIISSKCVSTANVGLGIKSEGCLIISGTKGYIYVSAPWWKTEEFEVKFEDFSNNQLYNYQFEGDGLRYEISEFLNLIRRSKLESNKLSHEESIRIVNVIERFMNRSNIIRI